MRKFSWYIALASILLCPLHLTSQEVKPVSKPQFKSIEVKHFTNKSEVQLSPNSMQVFYASFLAEMQRLNVANQTVEEGTPVIDTDKPRALNTHFLILEGTILSIQEGREKDGKIEATVEIQAFRRDDNKSLVKDKYKIHFTGSLQNDEQKAAESAGVQLAYEFRKKWYPGFKVTDLGLFLAHLMLGSALVEHAIFPGVKGR